MIIVFALAAVASAAVELDDAPVQGVEAVITVTDAAGDPDSGETVRVVHRPGLSGEKELAIGITDGRGRVRWRPEVGGVARIRAGEEIQMVRITPDSPPTTIGVLLGLVTICASAALVVGVRGPRPRS